MSAWISQTPVTVSLRRLFPQASFVGCADVYVTDATERSEECNSHTLFAAIPGTKVDGIQFVGDAIQRGASSILVDRPLAGVTVPQCVVSDVRRAYAELWASMTGYPSRRLQIAGVTGTNGKTTVAWLLRSIFQAVGRQTGILGTVEYHDGLISQVGGLTTPDSRTLSTWLASMLNRGTTHAAVELSSHALDQGRATGTSFDAVAVTNITQDHFDYHGDYESYRDAKSRILNHCKAGGVVVLNADDPGSASLKQQAAKIADVTTFGLERPADVTATLLDETLAGSRFALTCADGDKEITTSLVGRHNVSNCLASAAIAIRFGVGLDEIKAGIESLTSIPGRLERIDCGQPFDVFVDYAHTDDALRRCVSHLRQLTNGRVICVFGAGGDRDQSKRPLLSQAISEADLAVVTSDNPRTEDPDQIIADILQGFHGSVVNPYVEVDRMKAIRWAIEQAGPGDSVVVAGKGHETEQIIGTEKIPFDDREVVRGILEELPRIIPIERERIRA